MILISLRLYKDNCFYSWAFQFKRPVITGNDHTVKGNIDSGKGATGTPIICRFKSAPKTKNIIIGTQRTTDNLAWFCPFVINATYSIYTERHKNIRMVARCSVPPPICT